MLVTWFERSEWSVGRNSSMARHVLIKAKDTGREKLARCTQSRSVMLVPLPCWQWMREGWVNSVHHLTSQSRAMPSGCVCDQQPDIVNVKGRFRTSDDACRVLSISQVFAWKQDSSRRAYRVRRWCLGHERINSMMDFEWSWTYEHIMTGVSFDLNVLGGGVLVHLFRSRN
jgi:hypothetical protein